MSKGILLVGPNKDVGNMKEPVPVSPTEKKDSPIGIFSRFLRFDGLVGKKNENSDSPTSKEPPTTYYGVYIPCELKKGSDEETIHVYKSKTEALELMKKYKTARFKAFNNHQEAVQFTLRGAEPLEVTDGNDTANESATLMGEKPYPFKAPIPQEMVALRKNIEAGLTSTVHDKIWDNPRYLVSSGNTPAILQEGSRYNALHVAAKAMNAEMCNLILTTVGNPAFVQLLYGYEADVECCKEFAAILVDRYLNTPDKAMNETPLHFAAKFSAAEVIDVLTSYPQCNKMAVNKYGEQPKDIIGKRSSTSTPGSVREMSRLLCPRYYVPVLHCEGDSGPPSLGLPFVLGNPPPLNTDPLSPRCEIRAFAGPMEASDAETFRKKWKIPPRSIAPARFRVKEFSKGLETVGRNLAEKLQVGWKEYWPFLDTFTDLKTKEGLDLLEKYLKNKYESAYSQVLNESGIEPLNDEFSISRISLNLSSNTLLKDLNMSPMSELCFAMKSCTISNERSSSKRTTEPIRQRLKINRQIFTKPTENGDYQINHTVSQILCIERTLQVFAKRIADALICSLASEIEEFGDSLKFECKHLQHTMNTYIEDERFKNIDFSLIHSRLSQLIVFKLRQQNFEAHDQNTLLKYLTKIRCPSEDVFSSDDERKPTYRSPKLKTNLNKVIEIHVKCLSRFIMDDLTENLEIKRPSTSESECNEIWSKCAKCFCEWVCLERGSKRNASFRKSRVMLQFNDRIVANSSPPGDPQPTLYTVKMDKCEVVNTELVSSDESDNQSGDEFLTASEHLSADEKEAGDGSSDDELEMFDTSNEALVEPYIYGDMPSKMDRLVYEAISGCEMDLNTYPNIYRWRHIVSLHPPAERDSWAAVNISVEEENSPPAGCSTPNKHTSIRHDNRHVSLQVSNWLRVTGPYSPRSPVAKKHVGHNVSFGF